MFKSWRIGHLLLAIMTVAILLLIGACSGGGATPTGTGATPTTAGITAQPTGTAAVPTATATLGQPTATPTATVKRGGILQEVNCCAFNWDPKARGGSERIYIYNYLLLDPLNTGKPVCDLCETWSVSADGKTLTFKLRKDVKFHNGKQMTSADVKYSLAYDQGLVDGQPNGWAPGFTTLVDHTKGDTKYTAKTGKLDGVTTPDEWTVELHLVDPSALAASLLLNYGMAIIPENTTPEQIQANPIGTGPFMVKSVSANQVDYVRNPNYWKKDEHGNQLPYLDGVQVYFQTDTNVTLNNFLGGRLDIAGTGNGGVPPTFRSQVDSLEKSGKIVRLPSRPPQTTPYGLVLWTKKPPFDNLKVRQAINLAVDRKAQGEVLFPGAPSQPLLPLSFIGAPYARPESEIWNVLPGWGTGEKKKQEIEQAKKLMAEVYPNGYPDKVTIVSYNFQPTLQLSTFFANELAKIGINSEIVPLDSAQTVADFGTGKFNAWGMYFGITGTDPDLMWQVVYLPGASRSFDRVTDPKFVELYNQERKTADIALRVKLNREMEDILLRDLVNIDGVGSGSVTMMQSYVKGFIDGNTNPRHGGNRESIWIDK